MQLNLGSKIRELRVRDGRTQEALAEALGLTSQAVSPWESGGSYPDMEIIPSIANYFGVSIDELFGYDNERSRKIDALASRINDMNFQNNGEDINMDACIALAREALVEFPGNERLMLCLASVLYNAGYVRYGEYHLTDDEGYDVYDVEQHRTYAEWKEAISLYEKLLKTMEPGELRHQAIRELAQLYLNTGEHARVQEIVQTLPDIYGCREFLKINTTDGKARAVAYGEALLKTVRACSELMVGSVIVRGESMSVADKVESLRGAIRIFYTVCTNGDCGCHHAYIARIDTLLSLYLWLDGKRDEAFEALDDALRQFEMLDAWREKKNGRYSAPLVDLIQEKDCEREHSAASLAEDWPWWSVPEYARVKPEIEADPRWAAWVARTQKQSL